jgi:hypothetical protein
MTHAEVCEDPARRALTRRAELNGIDYVEVGPKLDSLIVHFLGRAPRDVKLDNVRIEGGRRVRDIGVRRVFIERGADGRSDDALVVEVDRAGDASRYELCFVEEVVDQQGLPVLDADGARTYRPLTGFDPRYHRVDFSFHSACPSDLDCAPAASCPPKDRAGAAIDYLAKDYASFRRVLLDRLALTLPNWSERHVPDLGITLVEILAYVADHLSYYQDAVATEAYLDTARRRISVRRHARLVDYVLHEGTNARAWVCVELHQPSELALKGRDVFFVAGRGDTNAREPLFEGELDHCFTAGEYDVFEPLWPDRELRLREAHNRIRFYTWGERECCLPRGATSATLADFAGDGPGEDARVLDLAAEGGDVLVFEEVLGPRTGSPADADPTRRHAVRLTRATRSVDPVTRAPVVEITWSREDALPFALCLSAIGPAPTCAYLAEVSVARGNVVAVDHGRSFREPLGEPSPVATEPDCECAGLAGPTRTKPGRFAPVLGRRPLTFRVPAEPDRPASLLFAQDPRRALPAIELTGTLAPRKTASAASGETSRWWPRLDLLSSGPSDRHFVVEIDDDRTAHLRFGDGRHGRAPGDARAAFQAQYRVGSGIAGNVGADTIAYLVTRSERLSGISLTVRNPLPARGGVEPESTTDAKLYAPHALHGRIERAVTADDYARIAERDFPVEVQRCAGRLRWTGSWYEAHVAVDARGSAVAGQALLQRVEGRLFRHRRVLHDLAVAAARQVPLEIELCVHVHAHHPRGQVKRALLEAFSNRTLEDGRLGFFHADRLSFGEDVFSSRIVALARSVPGVEHVRITRLGRLHEPDAGEIQSGVLRLGPGEIARLDNDPSLPENGVLRLLLEGGR